MKHYRILILHRHPLFAEGIASLLQKEQGVKVTAAAGDDPEVVESLRTLNFDVIVVEDDLGAGSALSLREIFDRHPEALVIRLKLGDNTANLYYNQRMTVTHPDELWAAIVAGRQFVCSQAAQRSASGSPTGES